MPLVKAHDAKRLHSSPIVMDMVDLEKQAQAITDRAQAKARAILEDATRQANQETARIRDIARQAGFQEGREAGLAEGRSSGHAEAVETTRSLVEQLVERWNANMDVLVSQWPPHSAQIQNDLVKLTLAVAAKVTRQEALKNRQVARDTLIKALELVGEGRKVLIRIDPQELPMMEEYLPTLLARFRQIPAMELLADEQVSAGGCLLSFGVGQVDARLESQLANMAQELLVESAPQPAGETPV